MRQIFLGFSCNNSCIFCAQGRLRSTPQDADDAAVTSALSSALPPSADDREIAFVGGEPTLHDRLPQWAARAKQLGASWVLVQTNGRRLVYAAFARLLADAGVDALDISLQGSTAPMHDYHTGVSGSWLQTVAGIEQARAAGITVATTTIVTRSNFRHLADIIHLSHSKGACAAHLDPARPYGGALAARDRVIPSPELVKPHLAAAIRLAKSLSMDVRSLRRTTSPKTGRLFAGIGATEPRPEASGKPDEPALGARKPNPGRREVHGPNKRSGSDLRVLFPGVFRAEKM